MLQYLVFVGMAVQLIGISSYLKETLAGKTKPNRVTWIMWAIAPLIGTAAALSSGVRLAVIPVFMAGFGPLMVVIASFISKKSYWKLVSFDYLCGIFSIFALILWILTKDPLIAIIFSILSDGFAAIPTIIKSWKHPETETVYAYMAGTFSVLTGLFAIKNWSVSEYAFPGYLLFVNTIIIFSISRRKFFSQKKNHPNH